MNNEVQLDITWDPVKAQSNISKHGVTFVQAASVLLDALALTHQHTGPTQVRLRLISAREATKRERQQYANEPR